MKLKVIKKIINKIRKTHKQSFLFFKKKDFNSFERKKFIRDKN